MYYIIVIFYYYTFYISYFVPYISYFISYILYFLFFILYFIHIRYFLFSFLYCSNLSKCLTQFCNIYESVKQSRFSESKNYIKKEEELKEEKN